MDPAWPAASDAGPPFGLVKCLVSRCEAAPSGVRKVTWGQHTRRMHGAVRAQPRARTPSLSFGDSFVLLYDARWDAPAVADRYALFFRPRPDITAALPA
jgi:hypothetical protein